MEIKKTSLNKLHQDNEAKFVEFAGYEMPIQYSKGIVEEHKFTRSNAGILMSLTWGNYLFMVMII
jgi:aminomethyltransferase